MRHGGLLQVHRPDDKEDPKMKALLNSLLIATALVTGTAQGIKTVVGKDDPPPSKCSMPTASR